MDSLVVCFRRHRDKGPEANSHVSESESKVTGSLMEAPYRLASLLGPDQPEQASIRALNTYTTGRESGRKSALYRAGTVCRSRVLSAEAQCRIGALGCSCQSLGHHQPKPRVSKQDPVRLAPG